MSDIVKLSVVIVGYIFTELAEKNTQLNLGDIVKLSVVIVGYIFTADEDR